MGGGIEKVEDARKLFNSGADKVTVNTGALKSPDLVNEISDRFGSQACVVAIDAKRRPLEPSSDKGDRQIVETLSGPSWYECSFYGGSKFTGVDALDWAEEVEERGAGEILLTSMDKDGNTDGYDIPLTKKMSKKVDIPIIASGGCGHPKDIEEVFDSTGATAALAASIFHYDRYSIGEVKKYLIERGIPVREQYSGLSD